jgi:hypothetical protein
MRPSGGSHHLKIQPCGHRFLSRRTSLSRMCPVAAQVNRDAVGAREFREDSRRNRIGLDRLPGLSNGCDVIDIHSQLGHCRITPCRVSRTIHEENQRKSSTIITLSGYGTFPLVDELDTLAEAA